MAEEVVKQDFEQEIDSVIDRYFSERGVVKDLLEISEKKLIIKELALANKKSEIVRKLNDLRLEANLPALLPTFDIFYYAREYAPLIEDISLQYASNLAKKYRFANKITRIGKLNDIAESVLDRVQQREGKELPEKEEKQHNENIKLFSQLLSSIDEEMGKLKMTKVDISVRNSSKPIIENAADVKKLIEGAIKDRFKDQLPSSVDANFSDITDYSKCAFAEEWTNKTFCQYFGDQCKVQTNEIKKCDHFCNKILLNNREWAARRYVNDKLSVRQLAEIAGAKEIDDKVMDYVRGKLKDYGIYRNTAGIDK